jgi:hypothetical protein
MQVPGGRQPVARIVADSADHRGPPGAEPGNLPAGGLHQPVDRDAEARLRERVDLLDLCARECR